MSIIQAIICDGIFTSSSFIVLPSINTHPDNATILTGQSVNLTCSATGTDVVYQWMRNGVIISDDNSNVLRINEIKQSDDGSYHCIASNKGGNTTSNPAMITVYGKRNLPNLQFVYISTQVSQKLMDYHIKHLECWMNSFGSLVMLLMIKMLHII